MKDTKIIDVKVTRTDGTIVLFATCDDGSLWMETIQENNLWRWRREGRRGWECLWSPSSLTTSDVIVSLCGLRGIGHYTAGRVCSFLEDAGLVSDETQYEDNR